MAVTIDGVIDDAAWQKARDIAAFKTLQGETPKAQTTGKILTDANYLYLAFTCDEPQMDKLQIMKKPRDGSIWTNDCIEIYVAPFADKSTFYHLIIDAKGQIYDAINSKKIEEQRYDLNITAATRRHADSWTLEMAVPLSNLGLTTARQPLMNFARERKPVGELTSWHGGFAEPDTWQRVPLTLNEERSVDVRGWDFGEVEPQYGENRSSIEIAKDSGDTPKVLLSSKQDGSWTVKNGATENVTNQIALPYVLAPQQHPQRVKWTIENRGMTVFVLDYRLHLPASAFVAELNSFYYYSNDRFALLDINTFLSPTSMQKAAIRLTVKDPAGNVVEQTVHRDIRPKQQIAIDISNWQQGKGAVFAELINGKRRWAYQRISIEKRPGPFAAQK